MKPKEASSDGLQFTTVQISGDMKEVYGVCEDGTLWRAKPHCDEGETSYRWEEEDMKPKEASVADRMYKLVHDIPDELDHRDRALLMMVRQIIRGKLDAKET